MSDTSSNPFSATDESPMSDHIQRIFDNLTAKSKE